MSTEKTIKCPDCGATMVILRFDDLQQNPAEQKIVCRRNKDGDLLAFEKVYLFCDICGYPEAQRQRSDL